VAPVRVLFWVQHLLGIGHVRRAARIASALAEAGAEVTVADGGFPVPGVDWGGARVVHLPPARSADETFRTVLDADGAPVDDAWKKRRAAATLALAADLRPDAILVESWPFARRPFRFELRPLIEMAARRRPRPAVLASVRDILVTKDDPAKIDEAVDWVTRGFDRVLVHGDPDLVPFAATFPAADRIADRIAYTGYVAPPAPGPVEGPAGGPAGGIAGTGEVIVSAGGGAVGLPLFEAALAARPVGPASAMPWRFLCGPDMAGAAVRDLAARAPAGVMVERARPDFPDLLARCTLSVSQAGYNTVMDLLRARCRAVVVPFARASETEQARRADLLAARGVLTVVAEAGLTPATLAAGIATALAGPPPPPLPLRLDGARETARMVLDEVSRLRAG
jgi:predicted glycosyltransferase